MLRNIYRFFARHKQLAASDRQPGTAAVEMAVVLPVLVMLFLGTVEVSRAIMVQHMLEEAARAGCRLYAVKTEATDQDVIDIVDVAMANAGITGYSIELLEDPPVEFMDPVTVSVSVPYDQVAWLPGGQFLSGDTLTGTVTMPADTDNMPDAGGPPPPPPGDDDDDGK